MNKLVLVILILIFCCKEGINIQDYPIIEEEERVFDDLDYVINENYLRGDVRRYGIFPDKKISQDTLKKILELSSKGLPIIFPKGFYRTNLTLDSLSNACFYFEKAIILGGLVIINDSNKIKFKGDLTLLDRIFIKNSKNISFDSVTVKSDTLLNLYKRKNRGVNLYAGLKSIEFEKLSIYDTGGDSTQFYKYSAAALQVHGWKNNPKNLSIKHLEIINANRTGLYLTGEGHRIEKMTITNFGLGSSLGMFGLEDAAPGEEREFSGVWLNRCNNCIIDTLIVNSNIVNGGYSLRLDEGQYYEPTFIYNLKLANKAIQLPIKDDRLTNILVKNEF